MASVDVVIVDYGAGNISSVANMVRYLGYTCSTAKSPEALKDAKKVILPGVGAFDAGMAKLNECGLVDVLRELAFKKKVPFLGICLGAQLLGAGSEEGVLPGLGWLDFKCIKFVGSPTRKVPHMGWNFVKIAKDCRLTTALPEDSRFYFVHSFYMSVSSASQVLFTTQYGCEFVSGVVADNIYGVQFHPEKSHKFGMKLLKNFLEI